MDSRPFLTFEEWVCKINEAALAKHEYGCMMLKIDGSIDWKSILDCIDEEDYTEDSGPLEEMPHVTLLYGIHSDEIDVEDLRASVEGIQRLRYIRLSGVSCFANEDWDVLHFTVDVGELATYREQMFEYPVPVTQTYPDYKPHITIAYLKKGRGKKYCQDLMRFGVFPKTWGIEEVVYSSASGTMTTI